MKNVSYSAISNGTILLQGESRGKIIVKSFDTMDEAISYADNYAV